MAEPRRPKTVLKHLQAAVEEHHILSQADVVDTKKQGQLRHEILKLRSELSASITKGAEECPDCGQLPHGIKQPRGYEVGCLTCANHRAWGEDVEDAVEAWNNGEYLPPRAPAVETDKEQSEE